MKNDNKLIFIHYYYMSKQNTTAINKKQQIPKPYKKRRYYILQQLKQHNIANDAWVSFFGDIYDLTNLIQQKRQNPLIDPLIRVAGTDITHWFDKKTKQPRQFINQKGQNQFYVPQGRYIDLELVNDMMSIPWWRNQKYFIGKLTARSQWIRIINTLSDTQDKIQVPREQTIWQILNRYEQINYHAKSYTWKRKGVPLNMDLTLEQNGIIDQSKLFEDYQVQEALQYIPAIHIHFNDDLTTK